MLVWKFAEYWALENRELSSIPATNPRNMQQRRISFLALGCILSDGPTRRKPNTYGAPSDSECSGMECADLVALSEVEGSALCRAARL